MERSHANHQLPPCANSQSSVQNAQIAVTTANLSMRTNLDNYPMAGFLNDTDVWDMKLVDTAIEEQKEKQKAWACVWAAAIQARRAAGGLPSPTRIRWNCR